MSTASDERPARGGAPARPTVWMVIASYHPCVGGAEAQVRRISAALVRAGWRVEVLTRRHGPTLPAGLARREALEGTTIHRVFSAGGGKLGSLLFFLLGLWRILRAGRGNVLHAHDVGAAGWIAVLGARLTGGRSLVKMRTGRHVYERRMATRFGRFRFTLLLRLAHRVLVVNEEVRAMLAELGVGGERVRALPNAVDLRAFRPPTADEGREARERVGASRDRRTALYVGRLEPLKGVDVLLEAWDRLDADAQSRLELVVVGDGSQAPALRRAASRLEPTASVRLVGARTDVRDHYWAADLFVLPSWTEGMSNALLEAMACGVPVVATAVGGTPEMVDEGAGRLCPPGDPSALAGALEEMAALTSAWPAMGERAREAVAAGGGLRGQVERVQALYSEMLDGAGADAGTAGAA